PVAGRTAAELRAYVEGADQVTGRPFTVELLEGLTAAVAGEPAPFDRERPRLLDPAGEDELHLRFLERGWTDKLPVVLPTEERVAARVEGTSHAADEVVGHLQPPGQPPWEFTVELVAANAVMAGARPAYLPAILALASTGLTARAG